MLEDESDSHEAPPELWLPGRSVSCFFLFLQESREGPGNDCLCCWRGQCPHHAKKLALPNPQYFFLGAFPLEIFLEISFSTSKLDFPEFLGCSS